MGVFACNICGNPAAWMSHSPETMHHDCPGPRGKLTEREELEADKAAADAFCAALDAAWDQDQHQAKFQREQEARMRLAEEKAKQAHIRHCKDQLTHAIARSGVADCIGYLQHLLDDAYQRGHDAGYKLGSAGWCED